MDLAGFTMRLKRSWRLPSGSSHRRVFNATAARMSALQRRFIDLVALVEIDCTPGVAFEAGVEEARGSSSEAPLAKVIFTTFLYVPAGADDAGVRPHRNPLSTSTPRPLRGRPA